MSTDIVYSRRFFLGSVPANTAVLVGTVPTGVVWVLRDLELFQAAGSGSKIQVVHQQSTYALITLSSPTGSDHASWSGRVVVNAGEGIQIYAPAVVAQVCLSGYQLGTVAG